MTLRITLEIGDYSFEGDGKFFNSKYKAFAEVTPITKGFEKQAIELTAIELMKIKRAIELSENVLLSKSNNI